MEKKYFPINTATACKLKWNWSTLYLNTGTTRSCHRTAETELTPENFQEFHNTALKISDRENMLNGQWPTTSCKYCKNIEDAGGHSDRMLHLKIPGAYPKELDVDPQATHVSPTILEVYFDNACNLGCLYCDESLSSSIAEENRKFGAFESSGIQLLPLKEKNYKSLVPFFWDWFIKHGNSLERLHLLGGESFYQKELDKLLDTIESTPIPNCEFNIVTNLMYPLERLQKYLDRIKSMVANRKIKRFDLTVSIDCWGPQQEYVRWGLNLAQFTKNFEYLIQQKWITININQTISVLTLKTMPDLIVKLNEWRKVHPIGHYMSEVAPQPSYMKLSIFGLIEFKEDFEKILSIMHNSNEHDQTAKSYMQGIFQTCTENNDPTEIKKLLTFLNEKDRRRNTNWHKLFPWLIKYEDLCGIQE